MMITKRMESMIDSSFSPPSTSKLGGISHHPGPRRNLFGRRIDDPSSPANWLLFAAMAEKSAADWNFDFTAGKPLPAGRFLWEPVAEQQKENDEPCQQPAAVDAKNNKCNKPRLVQSSIKKFMPDQKRRSSSNRQSSKSEFLSPCRVDYLSHTVVDLPRRS